MSGQNKNAMEGQNERVTRKRFLSDSGGRRKGQRRTDYGQPGEVGGNASRRKQIRKIVQKNGHKRQGLGFLVRFDGRVGIDRLSHHQGTQKKARHASRRRSTKTYLVQALDTKSWPVSH